MDWITIKEATSLVNKSNQAIYKLSQKEEYKKYFRKVNNAKQVSKEFIVNFYSNQQQEQSKTPIHIEEEENNNSSNYERIQELKETIENLRKHIESLQVDKEKLYQQLEIKDKQIEALTDNNKITQQLLNQQQQLQYQSVEKLSVSNDEAAAEEPKEETKGFFKRFFK